MLPTAIAIAILILTFLGGASLAVLVLLALEHRASLARMERKQDANAVAVAERLASERACMLRDMTLDRKKNADDEDSA